MTEKERFYVNIQAGKPSGKHVRISEEAHKLLIESADRIEGMSATSLVNLVLIQFCQTFKHRPRRTLDSLCEFHSLELDLKRKQDEEA